MIIELIPFVMKIRNHPWFLVFFCCGMAILMLTSTSEIRALRKQKDTQQSSIHCGSPKRKTQRRKEHQGKLRTSPTLLNCYSTQDVRLQLSLGVGNRQSRKSSKSWVDKGWEVFKVIGKGWNHPPRSSQTWLIVSVPSMSFTELNSFFWTFVVFEPHYQWLCCLL